MFKSHFIPFTWLRARWEQLQGHPDHIPLQSRIYHFVCLATIAVMIYVLIFSISVGMIAYALITAALLPLQIFLYYLSRFGERTSLSMKIYILLMHAFFAVGYRLGSGIAGSTLYSFCIVFFLAIAIFPRKDYALLTVVNLAAVITILVIEYKDPSFVLSSYTDRKEHFIDVASTYTVNIVLILVALGYIIKNYILEKDKAAERALLLDELHEEKIRLIAIISHDYQTPLAALQNYLYILDQNILSQEERTLLTAEMRQSIVNTQGLLMNLLDLTSKEIKLNEPNAKTWFQVMETVSVTLDVYANIGRSMGQNIQVSIPKQLRIYSDRHSFSIIIRNLVNNAVKFSGPDATIRLSHEHQGNFHVFVVADSGPGLTESSQKEILESWELENRNVARSGAIGLILANKYAIALGGKLAFSTKLGKGSTFYLSIPAQNAVI